MPNLKTIIQIFMCLSISVSSLVADEKASIENCTQIGRNFEIAPYLVVTEGLQKSGKPAAIAKLREWAATRKYEDQVFILCRMLFVPREKKEFCRPGLGVAHFLAGTNYKDWPLVPIALHKNMPILITYGYSLFGSAELSMGYVDYCAKECDWNKNKFKSLDSKTIASAVDDWLALHTWSKTLSDRDRAFFTKQAEQGGAEKPATALDSKAEGIKKPKLDSEGRSQ